MSVWKDYNLYQEETSNSNEATRESTQAAERSWSLRPRALFTPVLFGIIVVWSVLVEGLFTKELLAGYFILACLLIFRSYDKRNVNNKLNS